MRKHNYLIGYKDEKNGTFDNEYFFIELLTLSQAKQKIIFSDNPNLKIYKLVEVRNDKT